MKIEKKIELFVGTCINNLRGLFDLKRIVSAKNIEKYNVVQTQCDHFFERTIWV